MDVAPPQGPRLHSQAPTRKTATVSGGAAALIGLELALEVLLELDEVLWQRHAVGPELVQLAHDDEIDLVAILRAPLVLQLSEKEAELCLDVFKGHSRSIDPTHA